ncbi:MAG: DUF3500 domain-containing protein [Bacteroidetes bacterium]|nr:DUF3500 domain-containing protein [Bacteroidota bacterium]
MKKILIFFIATMFAEPIHVACQSNAPVSKDCSGESGLSKVVCFAEAFKATLNKEQLALVQLAYSKGDAKRWSNFPQAFARPSRVGLNLGSLTATQLSAFKALMASVLAEGKPNEGFDEMEGNLAVDTYFGQQTNKTNTFGSNYYVVVFLGKPSTTQLWELMFGGHHFAFANTYDKGKLIGATPSFRGVEPIAPVHNNGHVYQPLAQEREAFADIINLLNSEEKKAAKISSPDDILLGPGEDDSFPTTKQGIRIGNLNKDEIEKIILAIGLYVNDLNTETANQFMKKYIDEIEDTFIAYSGSGTMNQASDYIRLDGPSLWIEYSAQPSRDFPGTNHPHSIWRDRKSDYGGK